MCGARAFLDTLGSWESSPPGGWNLTLWTQVLPTFRDMTFLHPKQAVAAGILPFPSLQWVAVTWDEILPPVKEERSTLKEFHFLIVMAAVWICCKVWSVRGSPGREGLMGRGQVKQSKVHNKLVYHTVAQLIT